MNKNFKFYFVVWAILLVIFNIVVFVSPNKVGRMTKFGGAFWVGYLFITLAFIGQLSISYFVFQVKNMQKVFYKIVLIRISWVGLALTLVVGSACMVIPNVPSWIGIILCFMILGFNAISLVRANAAADIVSEMDDKIKTKIFINMRSVDSMANFCSKCGAELSAEAGFCPNCGNKVGASAGGANSQMSYLQTSNGNIANKNMRQSPIGITAGVLGICGAVLIPVYGIGAILGIPAIILGIIGLKKKDEFRTGMALTGIITGGITVVVVLMIYAFGAGQSGGYDRGYDSGFNRGYDRGYDSGYEGGYDDGYEVPFYDKW